jgi:hypothetical protein
MFAAANVLLILAIILVVGTAFGTLVHIPSRGMLTS